jgi:predicted metal-dependent hydrolase
VLRRLFSSPATKTPEPVTIQVVIHGEAVTVHVRRSSAARRLTLRVRSATGDVVLTLPQRAALSSAQAFAERQAGWIATRLATLPEIVRIADGVDLPLRGVAHRVVHGGGRGTTRIAADADGRPELRVCGPREHLPRRAVDFLRREAKADLDAAARRYATVLGVELGRITIRDTRSRWGSCSSGGDLSFSWRLVLAPPFVLDYVAAHEVAHRREMNHSACFWTVLRDLCPETDRAELWLKRHGAGLHRFVAR